MRRRAAMARLVLELKGRELRTIPIVGARTHIGRDATCEVCIDNPGISRVHAEVRFDGSSFWAVDRDSANGIYVSGRKVGSHQLRDGDAFQVGKFSLVFHWDGGTPLDDLAPAEGDDAGQPGAIPAPPANPTFHLSEDEMRRVLQRLNDRREEPTVRTPVVVAPSPRDRGGSVWLVGFLAVLVLGLSGVIIWLVVT